MKNDSPKGLHRVKKSDRVDKRVEIPLGNGVKVIITQHTDNRNIKLFKEVLKNI